MTASPEDTSKLWLSQQLRSALIYLYDPIFLRSSPLGDVIGLKEGEERALALRSALLDAIEALLPLKGAPSDSKSWRVYQVLRRRFVEQASQRGVAMDLGLSVRQLQREEKYGRDLLVEYLWDRYKLADHLPLPEASMDAITNDDEGATNLSSPTRAQELAWLQQSVPIEDIAIADVLSEVVETVGPLLRTEGITLERQEAPRLPTVPLRSLLFRQCLVNILSACAEVTPGGHVLLATQSKEGGITIGIEATPRPGGTLERTPEELSGLRMARQLLQLCGGTLSMKVLQPNEPGARLRASVELALANQAIVLVIDDNADALQLIERYLAGSRYRFIGASSAARGLELAKEEAPSAILLDVMMPEQDGWKVLGWLRNHPIICDAEIVVCTILEQEQLALALGASAFIRKPVRRADLLATLDRLLAT